MRTRRLDLLWHKIYFRLICESVGQVGIARIGKGKWNGNPEDKGNPLYSHLLSLFRALQCCTGRQPLPCLNFFSLKLSNKNKALVMQFSDTCEQKLDCIGWLREADQQKSRSTRNWQGDFLQ
ncbi:hypothetical protein BHE74_00029065, partial [Ensete ventricosum]